MYVAEGYFDNAPVTEWQRGQPAEVYWRMHAEHRGGYAYRLCKVSHIVHSLCLSCHKVTCNFKRFLKKELLELLKLVSMKDTWTSLETLLGFTTRQARISILRNGKLSMLSGLEKGLTRLVLNGQRLNCQFHLKRIPNGLSRIWFKFLKTLKLEIMFCLFVGNAKILPKFGIHAPISM